MCLLQGKVAIYDVNLFGKVPINPDGFYWDESRLAIRELPFGLQRWRGRFLTNCSDFSLTLHTWKYQDSYACLLCDL